MKSFLAALSLFFSLLILEFIVYVFVYFCFSTDFVALVFLKRYPWILRSAVITGFVASLVTSFIAADNRPFFIAICVNMIVVGLFFEYALFKTLDEPIHKMIDFYFSTEYIIKREIRKVWP